MIQVKRQGEPQKVSPAFLKGGDMGKCNKVFIGLDNGGTTTKAAVFDMKGNELGVASVSTDAICERPLYAEREMEDMWDANCRVIREVLEKTGTDPKNVACIAVCGHGKGLYLWGKDDKPVRNGILSSDTRAYAIMQKWQKDGTEAKAGEMTIQHLMAFQPVVLLRWLKDNEPESYRNIRWVFECKDYVRFRLTGKAMAERSDYSGANLVNLYTQQYDPKLLELFGIPEVWDALPPLCYASDLCGTITAETAQRTGLIEGTPVAGGAFDIDACALATGVIDDRNVLMIAGTWSINEYVKDAPVTDGTALMNSLFCIPGTYLVEESSPTSAGNNEWFVRNLLPELSEKGHVYDEVNKWVEEIPPQEFVPLFLPFILASNVHPNAKGSIIGITANHTRKHVARAIYEGIVFCHRWHFERLLATRKDAPEKIRLAGGATKSKVWVQMFADVMQLPVETVMANETGALGCAIAGAVATGVYKDLPTAITAMSPISPAVMPNPDLKEIYDKKYGLYTKAIDCLDCFWSDMQKVVEGK